MEAIDAKKSGMAKVPEKLWQCINNLHSAEIDKGRRKVRSTKMRSFYVKGRNEISNFRMGIRIYKISFHALARRKRDHTYILLLVLAIFFKHRVRTIVILVNFYEIG
ncbi:hypothetical protein RhiirA5_86352 [Rhizophagus irregularis]|uniref:Uncharacterized protein n=1 Tax=Rhizophagus irregularis TaxID=588596 RepID=A0A2N1NUA4_9GLOM|nr:hypothetical protein RhiirA5_86352 [Rhizophagus irregularis]PKK77463.1 hypothetical protein RhiirC2_69047 [Rhizophagus irregularis]